MAWGRALPVVEWVAVSALRIALYTCGVIGAWSGVRLVLGAQTIAITSQDFLDAVWMAMWLWIAIPILQNGIAASRRPKTSDCDCPMRGAILRVTAMPSEVPQPQPYDHARTVQDRRRALHVIDDGEEG